MNTLTAKQIDDVIAWSRDTFGPAPRVDGVLSHMSKEIEEIRRKPGDLEEWIDMIVLAIDGAQRNTGATGQEIIYELKAKWAKNQRRDWPDWRTRGEDEAIEHVRGNHD